MRNRAGGWGHLAIVFAAQIIVYLQGLIALPIVIRLAGEAVYGAYVLLLSMLLFLFGVCATGATYPYRRDLVSASSLEERRRLFEPQFTLHVLALGIVSPVLVAAGPWLGSLLFGGAVHFTSWLLVAWLISYTVYRQEMDYFRFTLRLLRFNVGSGGFSYLFIGLLAAAAAFRQQLSVDALLVLQITAYAVISLALLPLMLRELGLPRLRLRWRNFIADARVGLPLMLEFVADFLLSWSDRYLISLFLTVADVGRYQPAYQLGSILTFLPKIADSALIPAVLWMVGRGERAAAERLVGSFVQLFWLVAWPFAVGALMLGPSLVSLIATPEIGVVSRYVTPLIAVASVFYGITLFAFQVAYVLGRAGTILGAYLAGAALNIGLNLLLLPRFQDIMVPAATTLVGYVVSCLYITLRLPSVWRIHLDWRAALRFLAAATWMAVLLWSLGYRPAAVASVSWLALSGAIAAAIVVYFSVLGAIGGFGSRERAQIAEVMGLMRLRAFETDDKSRSAPSA